MPFIKVGNRIINTGHITSVELHFEQPAFEPPDLEDEEPDSTGTNREKLTADLVRVHFEGSADSIVFYHNEAKALREYFTDKKNITDIMVDDPKETAVGFG